MPPESNDFEIFSYNPFMANETLSSEFVTDVSFYQNISSLDTDYYSMDEVKLSIANLDENSFSVLYVNIKV